MLLLPVAFPLPFTLPLPVLERPGLLMEGGIRSRLRKATFQAQENASPTKKERDILPRPPSLSACCYTRQHTRL